MVLKWIVTSAGVNVYILAVVPARYASQRFPGKVLAKDTGKYLIQHVYEQVTLAKKIDEVVIAVDEQRVLEACESFGARAVMTRKDHKSGTDRIAEVAGGIDAQVVVNIQGDEPQIDPGDIDRLVGLFEEKPDTKMATLIAPFEDEADISNPNIVKCVTDFSGRAIYFSRSVIPYDRNTGGAGPIGQYRRHLGIYGYERDFLLGYSKMRAGVLEEMEKLEQLRALENGYSIETALVSRAWDGIDTREQYDTFVARYQLKTEKT